MRHRWAMPQYIRSEAIGASAVHNLTLSARNYQAKTEVQKRPKAGSDAAKGGSLFHSIVLQPEQVAEDFPIWVTTHASGKKAGKARVRSGNEWDEFEAAHPGKTIVTDKQMETAERISERAMANKQLQELLQAGGEAEVSWTWWRADCLACGWSEQAPGVRDLPRACPKCGATVLSRQCKKRPDLETPDAIIDLKLTRATSAHAAKREGYKYGWGVKAPWYVDGAAALGRGVMPFYFLVVQNVSPWDVALVPVKPNEMDEGRRDITKAMALLGQCEASGVWPGPLAPLAAEGFERPYYAQEGLIFEEDNSD